MARSLEREVKKLPTLRRLHRRQPLLNVFYSDLVELRAGGQAALADVMTIRASCSLVEEGRVVRHGADHRSLRPRHARHPPSTASVARARLAHRAASSTPETHSILPASSTSTTSTEIGGISAVLLHVAARDVLHSRVARSDIQVLTSMGVKVTVVGPPPLIPRALRGRWVARSPYDIDAIGAADVIYVLRTAEGADARGSQPPCSPAGAQSRGLGCHQGSDDLVRRSWHPGA